MKPARRSARAASTCPLCGCKLQSAAHRGAHARQQGLPATEAGWRALRKRLAPQAIAKAIDLPVANWPGNCYSISLAVVEAGLVVGDACYGHWHGPVVVGGHFNSERMFQRHGWIDAGAGWIVDLTRWVFEGRTAYVYHGGNHDGYYDVGGNALRAARVTDLPPARPGEPLLMLALPQTAQRHLAGLGLVGAAVTHAQAHWLANLPIQRLGAAAAPLYDALRAVGAAAYIPIDNAALARRSAAARPVAGPLCLPAPPWAGRCLLCNDVGEVCRLCAEPEGSCRCPDGPVDPYPCPDCGNR